MHSLRLNNIQVDSATDASSAGIAMAVSEMNGIGPVRLRNDVVIALQGLLLLAVLILLIIR